MSYLWKLRVDRGRGLLARAHGEDDGRCAGDGVAAGIDTPSRVVMLSSLTIEAALLVRLETRRRGADEGVRGGAEGHDDGVDGELELAALDGDGTARRPEASGSPSSMRTHSIAPARPLPSSRMRTSGCSRTFAELDPLFLGVMQLFQTGGHFRLAAAIDDVNMLRAETLCAAGGVHGNVAAADDRDTAWTRMTGVSLCVADRPS